MRRIRKRSGGSFSRQLDAQYKTAGAASHGAGFDRRAAGFQIRFTALGIPITTVAGQVRPKEADVRPSADLCNRAGFDLKDP